MSIVHKQNEVPSILQAVDNLARRTKTEYNAEIEVRRAFLLGLWYKQFPDYMLEHLERGYQWDLEHIDPENKSNFRLEQVYPNLLKFQFISDTGDSWHQVYRDLRSRGWHRFKVHREGGRLQYLFEIKQADKPQGYQELWLLLDISIATCKQVQVGTQMVEQPIFETKCEDLVELHEHGELMWQDNPPVPPPADDEVRAAADAETQSHVKDDIPF